MPPYTGHDVGFEMCKAHQQGLRDERDQDRHTRHARTSRTKLPALAPNEHPATHRLRPFAHAVAVALYTWRFRHGWTHAHTV
jgi:hypothetical protein